MQKTVSLARSALFQDGNQELPFLERVKVSYVRAQAVANVYKLTVSDILHLSPKYWEFHTDPIFAMDFSVGALLTIQYNLCIGTLAGFRENRPALQKIVTDLLEFNVSGQYCLSEVDHGLDAINMETTATLQPNGEFIIHTPHPGAAKYMPPTCPFGLPCVAIVFARLIVAGEDRGIRGFVVKLHDGDESKMVLGITCKKVVSMLLSPQGGTHPLGHSLTYFNQVRVSPEALLGNLEKPKDIHEAFFQNIHRIITGTLSIATFALTALRVACYIATSYSLGRQVINRSTGIPRPISSFSTQYIPLLTSIAKTLVFRSFGQDMYEQFVNSNISIIQKHLVAAVFKTTVFGHTHDILMQLGERCGARGLCEVNQLSILHADMRAGAIAEGDVLVISIRFAIDIIRNKVQVPDPAYPDDLLARHEQSVIQELRSVLKNSSNHRSTQLEALLLPHCRGILEAVGHRCAYEAAIAKGLPRPIIDLFVASLFERDAAWYSENAGLSRWRQKSVLLERATKLYQELPQFLPLLEIENYVTAPIASKERWDKYVSELPTYTAEKVRVICHSCHSTENNKLSFIHLIAAS
ncbi:hypothetical protein M422DRAFT_182429 [Sphaerobolus stellatus SS14]|uniref:Acyl-CoA oxidase C-alpha1 domain-containing protein n=1 Tax=Sphaerobolus stellatus (strain SS14) TaxID=990650 RepID=A0A0C9TUY0_SPHS4|nr:hypothetical protein M422DRAFT_182429 [Sphaerobolus stellatus SS14]